MVGFMGMGMRGNKMPMKRKDPDFDMDGLHHDFSDFSLSSTARKIRRLDAELPPIMEESELELESVNDKAIVLFKPLTSPSDFDMDGLHHDFSDFSLSSPARKIRRLDAELPPIMEESELESESVNDKAFVLFKPLTSPSDFDMDGLHHDFSDFSLSSPARKIRRLDAELPPIMEESELESESVTDKAIVLFKLLTSPLSSSPSSISVDSDLISGFKDEFIRAITKQNRTTIEEDKAVSSSSNNECLAVIQWAPRSQLITPPTTSGIEISELPTEHSELTTEADDSMEIEDTNENTLQSGPSGDGYGGIAGMWVGGEGLRQWQQQHCMVPQ